MAKIKIPAGAVKKAQQIKTRVISASKKHYTKTATFIKRRPLVSFFGALGLLLLVLIVGRILQQQPQEKPKEPLAKSVSVYSIGDTPKATFQAKVEKAGVVKIIAQTGGIVQQISVKEGQKVAQGQQVIALSSTYQGGNAQALQCQIAQVQYNNVLDTFDFQRNVINNQRSVATASAENSSSIRELTRVSANEADHLVHANQQQLDTLRAQLDVLIASGAPQEDIFALQGTVNQVQGGLNQLVAQARTSGYQAGNDKPPALLEALQKSITFQQLDLQEKGLTLNKDIPRLQLNLASINEQTMYPASPFAGIVEQVSVHVGQAVSPGMVLATVSADNITTTAVLMVPEDIVKLIVSGEPSELLVDGTTIEVTPTYVSSQATDGQLYAVLYDIPIDNQTVLVDGEYITVNVPIAPAEVALTLDPFVPIDAVYQSQDRAFVLLAEKDKAETREVKLGHVYGGYVEVLAGLSSGDHVIMDRTVVAGERVKIK